MRNFKLILLFCCLFSMGSMAQEEREIKVESSSVTNGEATINGTKVPYKATAGTMPVWDEDGKPIASLFFTYYERTDVSDKSTRPLVFSFNGGPGSGSLWMHLAYTGPYVLNIDEEGYPLQPYGVKRNPHSILDAADIIYIDPVNTGYSRIVDKEVDRSTFFGVNADIKYLADWVKTFVTRQNRWQSPKYLIGESYGTTRVSGLVHELQNSHWMYFNGVILVSPTGLGLDRSGPVAKANYLPYFAATAWYHEVLPSDLQSKDLDDILPEVEKYTLETVLPAIAKGGSLDAAERKAIAKKMAYYSGIKEEVFLQHGLAVPTSFYWKELMRDKGLTVGRLDSRYRGIDQTDAGDRYDYDPALTAWNHAFSPAMNYYAKNVLKYDTDLTYYLFGPVRPWDRSNDNTGNQLAQSMLQNPYLHVMTQSGYFDGGTDYFNAKYNMWQMDPLGKLQDRMFFKGYRSGHMMYLRAEDLKNANDDIREFIKNSLPEKDEPAKYW
ncbi:Carboxypeptidase-related protein [Indibacter alkaliphilus LW1]|uniref:Carboxypeptidase-related protein n=1 Tax=Indibacter alkaliphilus (strain CCUG 57479 / KCTC 22604 / LW1) TaxID=1189612 RepID=S2DI89_INDAL|nr:carboxypeptidase [Indibacter alkaliphilus]EOZ98717.1 Carboxypeptidase-related protein [Indibacter alkaliphilus LW1]